MRENNIEFIPAQRFADLILDIGTFLLSSGAHCGRINSNLNRLALRWGFEVDMDPTFKGLLVRVKDINNPDNDVTSFKVSPPHYVHLEILTKISHLSWRVIEENLSIDCVEREFEEIKNSQGYEVWQITLAVGIACAGLCFFAFGDIVNALITFVAAGFGYMVRAKVTKHKFNQMIAICLAAFVTTSITGMGNIFNLGEHPEASMATAVLYLIPGVPLINCVIDLIEGYLLSAISRALFGGFVLLCIAAAMTLCITIMGINNFI